MLRTGVGDWGVHIGFPFVVGVHHRVLRVLLVQMARGQQLVRPVVSSMYRVMGERRVRRGSELQSEATPLWGKEGSGPLSVSILT